MGAAGYVEELLGVRGCELIGSATKVDCGRRLQQFDLRYRGPVPASCPECGGTLHSHGARTVGVVSTLLALPQNQPNAPLYPAGGAPGSRPGALPHFGRPRYLGPPPRARSTAG